MSKTIALFAIVLASIGLYLQSQGKLKPALSALVEPTTTGTSTVTVAEFVIAFLVYLFILSFLKPSDGMGLTVVVVMGALLVNHERQGNSDLLHTLTTQ